MFTDEAVYHCHRNWVITEKCTLCRSFSKIEWNALHYRVHVSAVVAGSVKVWPMPKYYSQAVLTTRPHAPQNVRCYAPTLARDLELMTTTSHPSRCWWLMLLVGLDSFATPISAWVRALPPNYAAATKMGCGTSLRWNYYVGQCLPQYAYPTVLAEWLQFWEWNALVGARLALIASCLFWVCMLMRLAPLLVKSTKSKFKKDMASLKCTK